MTRHDEDEAMRAGAEDSVSQLLQLAGPRPRVPEAARQARKQAVHAAWQAKVEQRNARRRRQGLLAAAVLAGLVIASAWLWDRPPGAGETLVARVEVVTGAVSRSDAQGSSVAAEVGSWLVAGTSVTTDAGRLALRLPDGTSVRLDHHSRLRLAGPRTLALERGALYADSGREPAPRGGLEVQTPYGSARDIGTQFEVRLLADELELRVREGEVRLALASGERRARAGAALTVDATGAVAETAIATYGETWSWTLEAAPTFSPEGRTVRALLDWLARETGQQLRFVDGETERAAGSVLIHSSLNELAIGDAPALLQTADLSVIATGGVLHVERSEGSGGAGER